MSTEIYLFDNSIFVITLLLISLWNVFHIFVEKQGYPCTRFRQSSCTVYYGTHMNANNIGSGSHSN